MNQPPNCEPVAARAALPLVESRRPLRLWMTGSLAVVMAALIPIREVSEFERDGPWRMLRHSRYTVGETVQRIEAMARGQGVPVVAVLDGARPLMVFGSSVGGTLAVMDEAHSMPVMPMSLMVRAHDGGGADVLVCAEAAPHPDGVPMQVFEDVRSLPVLVENALA
jgi:hypothetical protein